MNTTTITGYDEEGRDVAICRVPQWLENLRPGTTHMVTIDERVVYEGHQAEAVRLWRTLTASDLGALSR